MPKRPPTPPTGTINRLVADSVRNNPARPALSSKIGKEWKSLTFAEVEAKARSFSLGLRALGVQRADRVAVLSENRPEWAIADLAILAMGAVTVPIYPSLPPSQVAHILADSGARALVASDAKQLQKALDTRDRTPALQHFITIEPAQGNEEILCFDDILQKGDDAAPNLSPLFEDLRDSINPADLASLVYTSGTTGEPKGAMLTHNNLFIAVRMARDVLPFDPVTDIFLSFLPLCHVFERVTYYLALSMGSNTYYAENVMRLRDNMLELRPTIMQNVPRVYESMYDAAKQNIAKMPERRRKTVEWGIATGIDYQQRRNAGRFVSPILGLKHAVADKLVLSKLRERLGGRWRFFVSGGAPLTTSTAEFFRGVGIPIIEGYGLTETTAGSCANPVGRAKIGTVGTALEYVQFKIAADGEILISGPNVMRGYWNHPTATDESIDADGWFHTGDIGTIDREGYIKLTDRKKDIIVLANGKKVAPQPIENLLRTSPLITEIVLLGDSTGTISALVIPDFDHLGRWAKEHSIAAESPAELADSPEIRKAVKQQIDALSSGLADFEKVRRIALLDHPLSIDEGELTPTMKVKRRVVQARYGHLLE